MRLQEMHVLAGHHLCICAAGVDWKEEIEWPEVVEGLTGTRDMYFRLEHCEGKAHLHLPPSPDTRARCVLSWLVCPLLALLVLRLLIPRPLLLAQTRLPLPSAISSSKRNKKGTQNSGGSGISSCTPARTVALGSCNCCWCHYVSASAPELLLLLSGYCCCCCCCCMHSICRAIVPASTARCCFVINANAGASAAAAAAAAAMALCCIVMWDCFCLPMCSAAGTDLLQSHRYFYGGRLHVGPDLHRPPPHPLETPDLTQVERGG